MKRTLWLPEPCNLVRAVLLAVVVVAMAAPAAAQITTGTLTGIVHDLQGGVIPGASVILVSESRGTRSAPVVTNAGGVYTFVNVVPDTYTVEITLTGFKTLRRAGVAVSGADRVSVGVLTIEVGGMVETVEVKGESPVIQAQSGERSFTVTTTDVENLPISSRNFASLTMLTPGVSGSTTRIGGGGQNNIMMDGISSMDTGNNGQMLQMNVDAIAEVKVLTAGYQAEYGRSSGLQITAITKSGSNKFRGSVYDVMRNSDWNSNSWANQKNGDPKSVSEEMDWGYTIGGPVGKPGGNNKLFFFYGHEFRPRTSGNATNRFRVPTALERQGDFSQTLDNNGALFNLIRDASTGQPCTAANRAGCFAADGVLGRIPQNRLYGAGQAILNMWPLPNLTQQPGTSYNLELLSPISKTLQYQPAIRLDYQTTPSLRFSWRFTGHNQSNGTPITIGSIPGFNDQLPFHERPWRITWSASVNYSLNPTTFLEATYGLARNTLGNPPAATVANRFNAGLSGLPLLFPEAGVVDPRYYNYQVMEALKLPIWANGAINVTPDFQWGGRIGSQPPDNLYPGFLNINRTQDISISLTKVMGQHTTKVGFYLNHSYKAQNLSAGGGARFEGVLNFGNDTNNPIDSGFGFANAILGTFSTYQQQSKFIEGSYLYNQVDFFIQDNWKVNTRLTLDYGLRFVHQQPQYDQYLQSSNFFTDQWSASAAPALYLPGCPNNVNPCATNQRQARNPVNGQLLGPGSAPLIGQVVPNSGDALNGIRQAGDGISKYNYEWPALVIAPRFGAAYDVSGTQRLVLRGGVGLFYDRPNGNSVFSQSGNPPNSTNTIVRYGQLQSLGSGGLTSQGVPQLIIFEYDSTIPTSAQWNAGVQMMLPWSASLDVSYVAQHGFNLLQNIDINSVDFGQAFLPASQDPTLAPSGTPGATALTTDLLRPYRGYGQINQNTGKSWNTFHSLQTSIQRRFSGGVSGGLNWTLALSDRGNTGTPLRIDHNPDGSYVVRADQAQADELLKNRGTQRHVFKGNFVWDLPDLEIGTQLASTVVEAILNDWQLSGVWTGGSGGSYTPSFSYQSNGASVNLTGTPNYGARIVMNGDPGSGCSDNQYAQFNTAVFAGPVPPSVGLESGQNYLIGCATNTWDLAIARNFRLGGGRQIQVRAEMFNAFNTVIYSGRQTQLQLVSPTNQTVRNPQFLPDGSLNPARLAPRNAGFGAATGAQAMRSVQLQIRFQF